jgi:beta-1,2-mannosidase
MKDMNQKVIKCRNPLLLFLAGTMLLSCQTKQQVLINPETSWMLTPVEKHNGNFPLLKSDTTSFFCPVTKTMVKWQESYVFNPAAIVRDNKVYLIFRGEDKIGQYGGTSRLGLAVSDDGLNFKKMPGPVLYPDNDSLLKYEKDGGIEDPRISESEDGTYILTYTAFNGTLARLCIATSKDLKKWEKHGLAFGKAKNGMYANMWSKSGAIVSKRMGDRIIARKINGKYWMYWGETDIYLATSDNLIDWEPVMKEEKTGKIFLGYDKNTGNYDIHFDAPRLYFKTAVSVREGRFDSGLVEPGPPALLTPRGIFFIYNGMNNPVNEDKDMKPYEYSVGQIMFDPRDPSAIVNRSSQCFLRSEQSNEVSGQMSNTMFVEAMVHFKNKWFIYYTTGEAKIGAATYDKPID